MHLFQLEIITLSVFMHFISRNGTLLCDVTMTLIRQDKIGNIFFRKQHKCFLKKININHFYPNMHTAVKISTIWPAILLLQRFMVSTRLVSSQWWILILMFAVLNYWWVEVLHADRTTSMCIWTTSEPRVWLLQRKTCLSPTSNLLLTVLRRCLLCICGLF